MNKKYIFLNKQDMDQQMESWRIKAGVVKQLQQHIFQFYLNCSDFRLYKPSTIVLVRVGNVEVAKYWTKKLLIQKRNSVAVL